jgi:hypothetical protein
MQTFDYFLVAQAFQPVLAQAKACGYKGRLLNATGYEKQ